MVNLATEAWGVAEPPQGKKDWGLGNPDLQDRSQQDRVGAASEQGASQSMGEWESRKTAISFVMEQWLYHLGPCFSNNCKFSNFGSKNVVGADAPKYKTPPNRGPSGSQ